MIWIPVANVPVDFQHPRTCDSVLQFIITRHIGIHSNNACVLCLTDTSRAHTADEFEQSRVNTTLLTFHIVLLALAHSFSPVFPDRRYWSGLRGEFSEMKLSEWTLANCRSQADIFIYHWHPGCQSERPNELTVQRGAHPIKWLFERVIGEIVSLSCTPKLHYYTLSLFLHHIGFVKPGRWKQQRKYQNLVLILFQVSPTLRHKWYFALF